jgi:hypothetical protein
VQHIDALNKKEPTPGPNRAFSGILKDQLPKAGIPDAKVTISIDQNAPYSLNSDSNGVFSIRLSSADVSLRITAEAAGYSVKTV